MVINMNLRELREWPHTEHMSINQLKRLDKAIAYVHRKNAAQHKRHVFFKLRADEQRKLLR